jgi:hypothetical protein
MTLTHFVAKSGNSKTGHVSATYRERTSCPSTCPMLAAGCYAAGRIEGIARRHGAPGATWVDRAVADTPHGGVFRHLVVGDLLTPEGDPDEGYLGGVVRLAVERPDISLHIVYTHGWRDVRLQKWIRRLHRDHGIVVNASCSTAEEVEEAAGLGLLPTVVLAGEDDPLIGQRIAGRSVVVCPAVTHGKTCAECGLCGKGGASRAVVGFPAHGSGKRAAAGSTGR